MIVKPKIWKVSKQKFLKAKFKKNIFKQSIKLETISLDANWTLFQVVGVRVIMFGSNSPFELLQAKK